MMQAIAGSLQPTPSSSTRMIRREVRIEPNGRATGAWPISACHPLRQPKCRMERAPAIVVTPGGTITANAQSPAGAA